MDSQACHAYLGLPFHQTDFSSATAQPALPPTHLDKGLLISLGNHSFGPHALALARCSAQNHPLILLRSAAIISIDG